MNRFCFKLWQTLSASQCLYVTLQYLFMTLFGVSCTSVKEVSSAKAEIFFRQIPSVWNQIQNKSCFSAESIFQERVYKDLFWAGVKLGKTDSTATFYLIYKPLLDSLDTLWTNRNLTLNCESYFGQNHKKPAINLQHNVLLRRYRMLKMLLSNFLISWWKQVLIYVWQERDIGNVCWPWCLKCYIFSIKSFLANSQRKLSTYFRKFKVHRF